VTDSIQRADAVVLLAALVGEPDCDRNPKETVDVNLIGTNAVARACLYHRVPRFIFASTDSAYGIQEGIMVEEAPLNPISLYARLKAQAEAELLALSDDDFRPTILRMATIYGLSPRMRFDLIVNTLTLHAFTWADLQGQHSQVQCRRARVQGGCMLDAAVGGEILLETLCLWSLGNPTGV